MDLFLGIVLLFVVFVALAYPLYKSRPGAVLMRTNALEELQAERDGFYAALRDLDLDFQLGKLAEADYRALREKHLARAAQVLQMLDAVSRTRAEADASDDIEKEVAALRGRGTRPTSTTRARLQRLASLKCSNCGHVNRAGARFCDECGQALS